MIKKTVLKKKKYSISTNQLVRLMRESYDERIFRMTMKYLKSNNKDLSFYRFRKELVIKMAKKLARNPY